MAAEPGRNRTGSKRVRPRCTLTPTCLAPIIPQGTLSLVTSAGGGGDGSRTWSVVSGGKRRPCPQTRVPQPHLQREP